MCVCVFFFKIIVFFLGCECRDCWVLMGSFLCELTSSVFFFLVPKVDGFCR